MDPDRAYSVPRHVIAFLPRGRNLKHIDKRPRFVGAVFRDQPNTTPWTANARPWLMLLTVFRDVYREPAGEGLEDFAKSGMVLRRIVSDNCVNKFFNHNTAASPHLKRHTTKWIYVTLDTWTYSNDSILDSIELRCRPPDRPTDCWCKVGCAMKFSQNWR